MGPRPTERERYQAQLGTLRRMKDAGFAERHPELYKKYLTDTRDGYDRVNNTFREP